MQPRVTLGAATWIIALLLLPAAWSAPVREAVAWCAAGVVYLGFAARTMYGCPAAQIKSRAVQQDDSAFVILALMVLAVLACCMAIAELLGEAKLVAGQARIAYIALAAFTIFISWCVMLVVFTMHYAHAHYAPRNLAADRPGGLLFPHDLHPDYWDFLYFATSISASTQTSDVAIASKGLRRLVTLHAIIAFFFNTAVLALTINLAASMI